ncbi:MAG: ComF family protein [Rubrivivax sp.]|nr:ComF family protein [Rubrivivax sp.]
MLTRPAWPTQCELCRRWQTRRLCHDCAPPSAATRCEGCALRLSQAGLRCGRCQAQPLPFERCCCAVDYGAPWDGLIGAFKYHGQIDLAAALSARLLEGLDPTARAWPQLVLPVPLADERLAERGYNQAWELARRVASRLHLPASALVLQRPLARAPQAGLGRAERRRNLQGAFAVAQPARVAGRRVVLVDDVLTTGATAAEATASLLAAGAAAVQVWALARTP